MRNDPLLRRQKEKKRRDRERRKIHLLSVKGLFWGRGANLRLILDERCKKFFLARSICEIYLAAPLRDDFLNPRLIRT